MSHQFNFTVRTDEELRNSDITVNVSSVTTKHIRSVLDVVRNYLDSDPFESDRILAYVFSQTTDLRDYDLVRHDYFRDGRINVEFRLDIDEVATIYTQLQIAYYKRLIETEAQDNSEKAQRLQQQIQELEKLSSQNQEGLASAIIERLPETEEIIDIEASEEDKDKKSSRRGGRRKTT